MRLHRMCELKRIACQAYAYTAYHIIYSVIRNPYHECSGRDVVSYVYEVNASTSYFIYFFDRRESVDVNAR